MLESADVKSRLKLDLPPCIAYHADVLGDPQRVPSPPPQKKGRNARRCPENVYVGGHSMQCALIKIILSLMSQERIMGPLFSLV